MADAKPRIMQRQFHDIRRKNKMRDPKNAASASIQSLIEMLAPLERNFRMPAAGPVTAKTLERDLVASATEISRELIARRVAGTVQCTLHPRRHSGGCLARQLGPEPGRTARDRRPCALWQKPGDGDRRGQS